MCSFLGSIGLFIAGLVLRKDYGTIMWAVGLSYFFLHPLLIELLFNLKALCWKSSLSNHKCRTQFNNKFPIVYSPDYNISFCGLERLHPFDS
jgi:hypothetical protein